MKIVHALGWYFPESLGGTEVYVAGLSRRLSLGGHDVYVVAPDPSQKKERTYEHEGLSVYRYPIPEEPTRSECQGRVPVRGTEHFHAWLRELKPDLVHIHSFVTGLGIPEIQEAKSAGARVIVTNHLGSLGFLCQRGTMMRWGEQLCDGICSQVKCAACALHGRGLPKPLAWLFGAVPAVGGGLARNVSGKLSSAVGMRDLIAHNQAMQRIMLDLVDKFVVLNQWAYDTLVANGAPKEKLFLNRLGLSQENVFRKPGPDERPTKSPVTVGYMGRFVAIKGVYDLAKAIVSLPQDLPLEVEFRGAVNDEESRSVLRELQRILGDEKRVRFAPAVPVSEVPRTMAGYDVLCCPSVWFENGPTVANEAHAVGTPVIGTRIGGLAELVTDGVNGRLVTPGDSQALSEVLQQVASDPSATVDRWRRALPPARTMDEITADYLTLYTSLN